MPTGPPSLFRLAQQTLTNYRHCLADLGYVPLWLLGDALAACSPQQLAHIEDATIEGSGRNLAPLTWPLWLDHVTAEFGAPAPGTPLPALPETGEEPAPAPQPGVQPAHYRLLYDQAVLALEKRREVSGKRLRQLWEQDASERKERQIQVIDPLARKRPRSAGAASPSGRAGAQPQQPAGARERLMKKLGISGRRGALGAGAANRGPAPAAAARGAPAAGKPLAIRAFRGSAVAPRPAAPLQAGVASPLAARPHQQQRQQQPAVRAGGGSALPARPPAPAAAVAQRQIIAGVATGAADIAGIATGPFAARPKQQQQPPQRQQQQQLQRQQQPVQQGTRPAGVVRSPPQQQKAQPAHRGPAVPPAVSAARQPPRLAQPSEPDIWQAGNDDGQDEWLLDEPCWLPTVPRQPKQKAEPQQQQQQRRQKEKQRGDGKPSTEGLLDEPCWLLPLSKPAKPKSSVGAQQAQAQRPKAQAGSPAGPKQSPPGGKVPAGQQQAAAAKGGLAAGKPKLQLPPPVHARTVSAVKKAQLSGGGGWLPREAKG